jgi:hypothetical protein
MRVIHNTTTKKKEDITMIKAGSTAPAAASGNDDGTLATESGSVSEDEGWLSGISSDFKHLAWSLRETAGGVAEFVHRSAVAMASEIARLEQEEEDEHCLPPSSSSSNHKNRGTTTLQLPWIITSSTVQVSEDVVLKEKILALSSKDSSFLQPYTSQNSQSHEFVLDEPRIQLIRRLLTLDDRLATTHAKLSGRSDVRESVFWRNYFHNCEAVREAHLRSLLLHDTTQHAHNCTVCSSVNNDNDDDDDHPVVIFTNIMDKEGQENDDDDDNLSFVNVTGIPSPPPSLGLKSVDSCIIVDDFNLLDDSDE